MDDSRNLLVSSNFNFIDTVANGPDPARVLVDMG